jgi:hypothetical protein
MRRDSNGEVIEHRQRRRSLAIANLRRISRNELSAEASAIPMPTLTMLKYLRSQYPSIERCMPRLDSKLFGGAIFRHLKELTASQFRPILGKVVSMMLGLILIASRVF